MHIFWKILLALAALIALWFMGKSAYSFYHHYRLSAQAPATIESWVVIQRTPSKFNYEVSYHFTVSGNRYEKKELLSTTYPNTFAAEGDLPQLKEQPWIAHYDPGSPYISSLENPFPLKRTLYALLSLAVFFYFFWLYIRYQNAPTGLD